MFFRYHQYVFCILSKRYPRRMKTMFCNIRFYYKNSALSKDLIYTLHSYIKNKCCKLHICTKLLILNNDQFFFHGMDSFHLISYT